MALFRPPRIWSMWMLIVGESSWIVKERRGMVDLSSWSAEQMSWWCVTTEMRDVWILMLICGFASNRFRPHWLRIMGNIANRSLIDYVWVSRRAKNAVGGRVMRFGRQIPVNMLTTALVFPKLTHPTRHDSVWYPRLYFSTTRGINSTSGLSNRGNISQIVFRTPERISTFAEIHR